MSKCFILETSRLQKDLTSTFTNFTELTFNITFYEGNGNLESMVDMVSRINKNKSPNTKIQKSHVKKFIFVLGGLLLGLECIT